MPTPIRIADSLAYRVHRLARVLRVNLLEVGRRASLDLTPEQWFVLNKLSHQDGVSQVDLTEAIFGDRPNITRMLQGLERRRWVRRAVAADDARKMVVRLTAEGRAVHDRFAAEVPAERARLFDGISEAELALVKDVLERLERNATGQR